MDELDYLEQGEWDAGFMAGSQVVVSRLGPYQSVFLRPLQYRRRFFHKVFDLPIENWQLPLLQREVGGVCHVEAHLEIRFQPSLAYVQSYPECLPDCGGHIRARFQSLVFDQAELALRGLEDGEWLVSGCAPVERSLQDAVQVAMAVHHVRCRCHCKILTQFQITENLDRLTPLGRRLQEKYLIQQRQLEDEDKQRLLEKLQQEQEAHRIQLEHQAKLLELERAAREMERQAQQRASDDLKAKLSEEEARMREQMEHEARRYHEQLQHEQSLQKLKLAGELEDMQQRLQALNEKDDCVKRELELLYLEKQRLLLQEEIRSLKQSGTERK